MYSDAGVPRPTIIDLLGKVIVGQPEDSIITMWRLQPANGFGDRAG